MMVSGYSRWTRTRRTVALVAGLGAGLGWALAGALPAAMVTVAASPAVTVDDQAGGGAAQAPADGQAAEGRQAGQGRGGRAGGGGRGNAEPPPADDYTGFTAIFDGESLAGWDGDPRFWRAENGTIVGQSTPENVVNPNSFLIWRGGSVADFELKLDWRFAGDSGNSGVQYRSFELPEVAQWVIGGYQADMDAANSNTGLHYGERFRGFLAQPGAVNRRVADGSRVVGNVGTRDQAREDALKPAGEWNQYHIIARGNVMIHILNGRVMNILIDDDPARRRAGLVALQIHQGPPMQVEFRNVYLKELN